MADLTVTVRTEASLMPDISAKTGITSETAFFSNRQRAQVIVPFHIYLRKAGPDCIVGGTFY